VRKHLACSRTQERSFGFPVSIIDYLALLPFNMQCMLVAQSLGGDQGYRFFQPEAIRLPCQLKLSFSMLPFNGFEAIR
jgi:hypothetical protein